jgi:DNA gyrase subunit A
MKDVRVMGRSTQGVRLVNLHEGDLLVAMQKIEVLEPEAVIAAAEEAAVVDAGNTVATETAPIDETLTTEPQ